MSLKTGLSEAVMLSPVHLAYTYVAPLPYAVSEVACSNTARCSKHNSCLQQLMAIYVRTCVYRLPIGALPTPPTPHLVHVRVLIPGLGIES